MLIDTNKLQKDEQVFLEMQQLFQSKGYSLYKMRRFEEYSLYLENKKFLNGENVITFNDTHGKLMALKPDVTLSIVKNARTEDANQKVYYRESVYRFDPASSTFKEINQLGLEFIGAISLDDMGTICYLAEQALSVIDNKFVFAISHMGIVTGIIEAMGISLENRDDVIKAIKSRNYEQLKEIGIKNGTSEDVLKKIKGIFDASTEFKDSLKALKEASFNNDIKVAVEELEKVYESISKISKGNNIRLDFTIINDIAYYNGIIFQGFVSKLPRAILSGGRYDRLLEKFNKQKGAMGFALSLSDLAVYNPNV